MELQCTAALLSKEFDEYLSEPPLFNSDCFDQSTMRNAVASYFSTLPSDSPIRELWNPTGSDFETFVQSTRESRWGDEHDYHAICNLLNVPIIVLIARTEPDGIKLAPKTLIGRERAGLPLLLLHTNQHGRSAHFSLLMPQQYNYFSSHSEAFRIVRQNRPDFQLQHVPWDDMPCTLIPIPGDGNCLFSAVEMARVTFGIEFQIPAPGSPSKAIPAPVSPSKATPAPVSPSKATLAPLLPSKATPASNATPASKATPAIKATPAPVSPSKATPAPVSPSKATPVPAPPPSDTPAPVDGSNGSCNHLYAVCLAVEQAKGSVDCGTVVLQKCLYSCLGFSDNRSVTGGVDVRQRLASVIVSGDVSQINPDTELVQYGPTHQTVLGLRKEVQRALSRLWDETKFLCDVSFAECFRICRPMKMDTFFVDTLFSASLLEELGTNYLKSRRFFQGFDPATHKTIFIPVNCVARHWYAFRVDLGRSLRIELVDGCPTLDVSPNRRMMCRHLTSFLKWLLDGQNTPTQAGAPVGTLPPSDSKTAPAGTDDGDGSAAGPNTIQSTTDGDEAGTSLTIDLTGQKAPRLRVSPPETNLLLQHCPDADPIKGMVPFEVDDSVVPLMSTPAGEGSLVPPSLEEQVSVLQQGVEKLDEDDELEVLRKILETTTETPAIILTTDGHNSSQVNGDKPGTPMWFLLHPTRGVSVLFPFAKLYTLCYRAATFLVDIHPEKKEISLELGNGRTNVLVAASFCMETIARGVVLSKLCQLSEFHPKVGCQIYTRHIKNLPDHLNEALAQLKRLDGVNAKEEKKIAVTDFGGHAFERTSFASSLKRSLLRKMFGVGLDQPNAVLADLGAGIGDDLLAQHLIAPDVKVLGFEEDEALHTLLLRRQTKFLHSRQWQGNMVTRRLTSQDLTSLEGITNVSLHDGPCVGTSYEATTRIDDLSHLALVRKIMTTRTINEWTSTKVGSIHAMRLYCRLDEQIRNHAHFFFPVKLLGAPMLTIKLSSVMWVRRPQYRINEDERRKILPGHEYSSVVSKMIRQANHRTQLDALLKAREDFTIIKRTTAIQKTETVPESSRRQPETITALLGFKITDTLTGEETRSGYSAVIQGLGEDEELTGTLVGYVPNKSNPDHDRYLVHIAEKDHNILYRCSDVRTSKPQEYLNPDVLLQMGTDRNIVVHPAAPRRSARRKNPVQTSDSSSTLADSVANDENPPSSSNLTSPKTPSLKDKGGKSGKKGKSASSSKAKSPPKAAASNHATPPSNKTSGGSKSNIKKKRVKKKKEAEAGGKGAKDEARGDVQPPDPPDQPSEKESMGELHAQESIGGCIPRWTP